MRWTVVLGGLLSLLWTPSARADPPPIEAFGRPPAETQPTLSPDGHWLAWIDQREDNPRIVLFDVPAHAVHRVLSAPPAIRTMSWADNGVLLVELRGLAISTAPGHASHEESRLLAVDALDGPARYLPLSQRGKEQVVLEGRVLLRRSARPHELIMSLSHCRCVAAVDTQTGRYTPLKLGHEGTAGWVVDRHGNPVLREDWDFKSHTFRLLVVGDDRDKPLELLRQSDANMPMVLGPSADGTAVLLLSANGRAHQAVWALPLDGSPQQLLVEDPQADITRVYSDPVTGAVIGVYVSGSVTTLRWLDPAMAKRQEALQRLFPGREVWQAGWTDDLSKVLVQVQGPAVPPTYYLVDYTTHRADIAAEGYPALAGVSLARTQETSYAARDGTPIPAYLTTPSGSAGPWPLILLPHDGPAARDFLQFNWMVQFLASRGYAVLQPQYRGSFGFGDAWLKAGFHQWGGLMQDDISDAVPAMVKLGIADPQRVCVLGVGFGGYAALAGAAFTPDLYRCAVSIGGISDIPTLVRDATPKYGTISSGDLIIKERIGAAGDPALAARSPINAAKKIHIPLLLLTGTGDTPERTLQTQRMAGALHDAGRPVEVDTFRTHMEMLREIEDFLKEHL